MTILCIKVNERINWKWFILTTSQLSGENIIWKKKYLNGSCSCNLQCSHWPPLSQKMISSRSNFFLIKFLDSRDWYQSWNGLSVISFYHRLDKLNDARRNWRRTRYDRIEKTNAKTNFIVLIWALEKIMDEVLSLKAKFNLLFFKLIVFIILQ